MFFRKLFHLNSLGLLLDGASQLCFGDDFVQLETFPFCVEMFKPFGCFVGSSVKVLDKSVMALPTALQVTLPARPRPEAFGNCRGRSGSLF